MIKGGLRYIDRFLGTITQSDNLETSLSGGLPKRYLYHQIFLRLSGTLTIAVADATSVLDAAPASLIKDIKITANGKTVIKSIDGATLYKINAIKHATLAPLTAPAVGVGDHAFSCLIALDLVDLLGKVPLDTMFNSNGLSTLDLSVTWGDAEDLVVIGGATLTWGVTPTLSVTSIESFGDIEPKQQLILNTEYVAADSEVIATTDKHQIVLATGNFFRTLILKATDAGVPENNIINNITLKSGNEVFMNIPGVNLREQNKGKYKLETMPAGFYVIDFAKYGSLADLLDATNMDSLKLELNVTKGAGETRVRVVAQEFIMPAVQAK